MSKFYKVSISKMMTELLERGYLGNYLGVGPRRISSLLKELADNNYIIMEYKHKFQRKIYINEEKFTSDLPEDFF